MNFKKQLSFKSRKLKHWFYGILTFLTYLCCADNLLAQTENAGLGTNNPDNSAVLDLSIDLLTAPRGFLAPRMTLANRGNIPVPVATGLMIYQTDNTPGFYYYNGSSWVRLFSGVITINDLPNLTYGKLWTGDNSNRPIELTLNAAQIIVGNGSNQATAVDLTGDATLSNAGLLTVTKIQSRDVANIAPTDGQVLKWVNSNSRWEPADESGGGGSGWQLTGNSGTNPTTNYLGTADGQDFVLRTNAVERIRITSTGSINIPGLTASRFIKTDGSSNLITDNLSLSDFPDLTYGKLWVGDNANRPTELTLGSGQIIVGNASSQVTAVSMSGDGTLSNAGLLTVTGLQGRPVANTAPTTDYVLKWNGTQWVPAIDAGGTGGWLTTGNDIGASDYFGTVAGNTNHLIIKTNNTERIRITSGGTVAINAETTTPDESSMLHVISATDSYKGIRVQGANGQTSNPMIDIYNLANGDATIRFNYAGSEYYVVGMDASDYNSFKISTSPNFNSNSTGYTATNLMMQIHRESGSEGIIDFNHQSRARAYRNATQSIPNNTVTKVQYNATSFDEKSEFDASTNYQFTAKETGYYQVNARVEFDFSSLGAPGNLNSYHYIAIYVDGSVYSYGNKLGLNNNDGTLTAIRNNNAPVVSDIIYLTAGQTIDIRVYQNTGGAYNIISGSANTYVSIHKLS